MHQHSSIWPCMVDVHIAPLPSQTCGVLCLLIHSFKEVSSSSWGRLLVGVFFSMIAGGCMAS